MLGPTSEHSKASYRTSMGAITIMSGCGILIATQLRRDLVEGYRNACGFTKDIDIVALMTNTLKRFGPELS